MDCTADTLLKVLIICFSLGTTVNTRVGTDLVYTRFRELSPTYGTNSMSGSTVFSGKHGLTPS